MSAIPQCRLFRGDCSLHESTFDTAYARCCLVLETEPPEILVAGVEQ